MHAMPFLERLNTPSDAMHVDVNLRNREYSDNAHYEADIFIIERRSLLGECIIAGLRSVCASMRFMLVDNTDTLLQSGHFSDDAVIIMRVEDEPKPSSPGDMSGIEKVKAATPHASLILVTDIDSPNFVAEALRLGAVAVIPTSMHLRVVARVLQLVLAGGVFVPASSFRGSHGQPGAPLRAPRADISKLSPRQVLVAKHLRKGTSNKAIAYDLNMCESTVKVHVRQIMKKLNARNRTQVAFLTNEMFSDDA